MVLLHSIIRGTMQSFKPALVGCFTFFAATTAEVIKYPAPAGLLTSSAFTVTVNDSALWVEKLVGIGSNIIDNSEVAIINFSASGLLTVKITASQNITSYIIRPKSLGIRGTVNGATLTFSLPGPQKLYIEINSLPHILFFGNGPEPTPPSQSDPNVIYYAPGSHTVGSLALTSNQTVYVAGGALVKGRFTTNGATNVKILGRGIIDAGSQSGRGVFWPVSSSNIEVNGVIMRNGSSWQNTVENCTNVTYRNVKVIDFAYTGDGIDPSGSRSVRIDSCFIRVTDDCVAIKNNGYGGTGNHNVDSISVTNCIMAGWDASDGVTIGYETAGDTVSNVLVKNCDVLYARGIGKSGGHSGFSIVCDGHAWVVNTRIEDVRYEEHVEVKSIELLVSDGKYYSNDAPGHIKGVYFKNIRWENADNFPFVIKGYSTTNMVDGVIFDNCAVGGEPLSATTDAYFVVNQYTSNIRFLASPGSAAGMRFIPSLVAVAPGNTVQLNTKVVDAFGFPIVTQPTLVSWSTSGGGSISGSGLFTASTNKGGPFTVTAQATTGGNTYTALCTLLVSPTTYGLNYSYYLGTWTDVPNFSALTPVRSGTAPYFSTGATARDLDFYGIQFKGYINIPSSGSYTFYLNADDGANLYLDGQLLVNNGGSHALQLHSASATLTAGLHPIRVDFYEKDYNQGLWVYWSGPGFSTKQVIPPSVLFVDSGAVTDVRKNAHSIKKPQTFLPWQTKAYSIDGQYAGYLTKGNIGPVFGRQKTAGSGVYVFTDQNGAVIDRRILIMPR